MSLTLLQFCLGDFYSLGFNSKSINPKSKHSGIFIQQILNGNTLLIVGYLKPMPFLHAEKPPLAVWELCKFYKHTVLLTDFSRARNCTAPPLGCAPPAEWEHTLLSAGTAPLAEQKERRISKLHSQQRLLCLQQKIRPLTKIFKLEQKSGDCTKPSSCLDSWVSDMVYWCENIASSESSRIYLFVLCMNLLVKLLFCNLSHRVFWKQQYFSRSQYFGVCSCHFKKPDVYSNTFKSEILILEFACVLQLSICWWLYFERFECSQVIPNSGNSWDCSLLKWSYLHNTCVCVWVWFTRL